MSDVRDDGWFSISSAPTYPIAPTWLRGPLVYLQIGNGWDVGYWSVKDKDWCVSSDAEVLEAPSGWLPLVSILPLVTISERAADLIGSLGVADIGGLAQADDREWMTVSGPAGPFKALIEALARWEHERAQLVK